MRLLLLVTAVLASLHFPSTNAEAQAKTKPPITSLQNRYDERLKALEDRIPLLTQKDDEIRTLIQEKKPTDPGVSMQAIGAAATHAIAASTEAVKHMQSFYAAAGTQLGFFLVGMTVVLTALGLVGGLIGLISFKAAAQKVLDKELKTFKEQVRKETKAIKRLRKETKTIRENEKANNEALTVVFSSFIDVSGCIIDLRETDDASDKSAIIARLGGPLIDMNKIVDIDKPKDDVILVWALTIRGTIYHLREEFERALKDFENGLAISPDRVATLYNAACSACRLGLKEKALSYIERALRIQPGRRAEAKADPDLEAVWADI